MEQPRPCFHLSIPAHNLERSRAWYEAVLGCRSGRCSEQALILDLAGHQLVLQRHPTEAEGAQPGIYPRHFGLVFDGPSAWQTLRRRVEAAGEPFAVAPKCRYPGELLEHRTFFLKDPSANWLEFKHYRHGEAILGASGDGRVGDPELR